MKLDPLTHYQNSPCYPSASGTFISNLLEGKEITCKRCRTYIAKLGMESVVKGPTIHLKGSYCNGLQSPNIADVTCKNCLTRHFKEPKTPVIHWHTSGCHAILKTEIEDEVTCGSCKVRIKKAKAIELGKRLKGTTVKEREQILEGVTAALSLRKALNSESEIGKEN